MFRRIPPVLLVATVTALALEAMPAWAGPRETATVETATQTLQEITSVPAKGIPASLLADAQGIAIIPSVVKLGFVVAGRHGRGIVLTRNANGAWGHPVFVTITGGSVGWQAGIQATDVILVFKTRKSVAGLMKGKFTLGADAAVAAGPVGRRAEAATDVQLKAEILSYSRSRGLFAGVSLEGSALMIDDGANAGYYGRHGITAAEIQAGRVPVVPAASTKLQTLLARLAPPPAGSVTAVPGPIAGVHPEPATPLAPPGAQPARGVPARPAAAIEPGRRALATSWSKLATRIDEPWQRYLALPAEVFADGAPPSLDAIGATLKHFDTVKNDSKFRVLAEMPEFRATDDLLRRYLQTRSAEALRDVPQRPLLPPPPSE